MSWFKLREMSAVIGLGLVGMLVCGILLGFLKNPIWVNITIGSIIVLGFVTIGFYFIFLWAFIEQRIKVLELEKELERIRKI